MWADAANREDPFDVGSTSLGRRLCPLGLLLSRMCSLSGLLVAVLNDGVGHHGVDGPPYVQDIIDGVVELDTQLHVHVVVVAEQLVQSLGNWCSVIGLSRDSRNLPPIFYGV